MCSSIYQRLKAFWVILYRLSRNNVVQKYTQLYFIEQKLRMSMKIILPSFALIILFSSILLSQVLISEAQGTPFPVVKDVFQVTESVDDRNLAKKKLIEELEKELEKLGEKFVSEKKRALDNIISKTGDVTNYSLSTSDVFVVYTYYALKGELPTNGISIYFQNIFSPLKQAKEGNSPQEIQCYVGLVKIIKNSDGTAVCTTLETAKILVGRDWGKSDLSVAVGINEIPRQTSVEDEGVLLIKDTQEYKTLIDAYGENIVSVKATNLLDGDDTLFLKEIDDGFKQNPGCIIVLEYENNQGYIYQLDKELNIIYRMDFLEFTESAKKVNSQIMEDFYKSLK